MSTDVQGLLKFSANGDPAGMLARVQAMVGELAALGVTPRVVVTVDLASTSRSSSSPISVATGMSGRGVAGMSTSPDPMPRSAEERSGIDGGERGGVVSDVSMSSGEVADFLEERGRGGEGENGQRSMVDWGVTGLSEEAGDAVIALENGETAWRRIRKDIRLELIQAVLAQPTESGRPMTMSEFDRIRPKWMAQAVAGTTTFGCSWPELRTLRLSE